MKTHHAIADGISAFDLFTALVSPTPDDVIEAPPWTPRPAPKRARLLADGLARQATTPMTMAQSLFAIASDPAGVGATTRRHARPRRPRRRRSSPPPPTPLNQPISAHRSFDWLTLDLAEVKAVKAKLGGTVNDVALASVCGGLHHFLRGRGADIRELQMRVVVPVSVRTEDERGQASNRASGWLLDLPVYETDPARRLAVVSAATSKRKAIHQELGPEMLGRVAEFAVPGVSARRPAPLAPPPLQPHRHQRAGSAGAALSPRRGCSEGFRSAALREPGLGIALFSYCGTLGFGFNADREVVPDGRVRGRGRARLRGAPRAAAAV